jgi:hypothetical protein
MEAGGFVLGGKGYIGTGDDFSSGNNYQDFWCYDPVANSWIQVADFGGAARRYLTCFSIGNRAYAGLGTSGTNYADFWEFGTISGTDEISAENTIGVFPNPVQTEATFTRAGGFENGTVFTLFNLEGKQIQSAEISGDSWTFERGDLPGGIYLYSINDGRQNAAGKLILQ